MLACNNYQDCPFSHPDLSFHGVPPSVYLPFPSVWWWMTFVIYFWDWQSIWANLEGRGECCKMRFITWSASYSYGNMAGHKYSSTSGLPYTDCLLCRQSRTVGCTLLCMVSAGAEVNPFGPARRTAAGVAMAIFISHGNLLNIMHFTFKNSIQNMASLQ